MVSFEDVLKDIGEFGRYQKFLYFFCNNLVVMTAVFNNLPIVFLVATPEHWCKSPSLDHLNITKNQVLNLTIPTTYVHGKSEYSQCYQYDRDFSNWTQDDVISALSKPMENASTVKCESGWVYDDSIYSSTIVSEWDLVCDRKMWVATSKSVYLAGFMAGVLGFGFISDRYGRKKAYFATVICSVVCSLLIPFSPNLLSFLVYRFLRGAISIGNFTVIYILLMELVGPDWREYIALIQSYIFLVQGCLFTGVAYLIRDWRHLAGVFAIPTFFQLANFFFIQESPRWLYTQGRNKEADAIMLNIAKVNRTKFPEKTQIVIEEEKKGKFCDLFYYPRLRFRMIILCVQWFTVTMVYYGLAYNSSDFGGDPYLNFFLGVVMEFPSIVICQVSQRFVGRRVILCVLHIVGGIALLGILAIPDSFSGAHYVTLTLALIGRLSATGVFIMIYLYSAELLPTVARSVGFGTLSATARIGGILAQYLMGLIDVSIFIPYVSMGGLSLLAGSLLFTLPETKGRELPETIQEGENFGRKEKKKKATKNNTSEEPIHNTYI